MASMPAVMAAPTNREPATTPPQRQDDVAFIKPSQREVFRNRIFAGETQMSVWTGWENGVPTSDFSPLELAPTSQHQYQWPMWGQYRETKGQSGEPIDMDVAKQLDALFDVARLPNHPKAEEARDVLEVFLDDVDWDAVKASGNWDLVRAEKDKWLKENPDQE